MSYRRGGDGGTNSPHDMQAEQYGKQNRQYKLSDSERRVLAECRSESFYYRSLPFATVAALSTHQLIRMGYLTTGRFGQIPKISFAVFFGYIAGKISYFNQCNKKFMRLENSEIGEMLRKGKGFRPGTLGGFSNPMSMDSDSGENQDEMNQRPSDDPHVNLDIDTSQLRSLDDKMDRPESLYQFDIDNDLNQHEKPKLTTTYEELRKKNRGRMPDHFGSSKQPQSQQQPAISEGAGLKQPSKVRAFEDTGFSKSVKSKVNTYGDSWDE